jgi:hypothetical protein
MANQKQMTSADLFIDLLKDPYRKLIFKILTELISLFIFYKSFPRQYFSRYLFKKDILNIKDYMPDKFLYKINLFLMKMR